MVGRLEGQLVHENGGGGRWPRAPQGPVEILFEGLGQFFRVKYALGAPRKVPDSPAFRGLGASPGVRPDRVLKMPNQLSYQLDIVSSRRWRRLQQSLP